jgi:hypothetical protein
MLCVKIETTEGAYRWSFQINQAVAPVGFSPIAIQDERLTDDAINTLIDGLRDGCEPISEYDFDPREGMQFSAHGFVATIFEELDDDN